MSREEEVARHMEALDDAIIEMVRAGIPRQNITKNIHVVGNKTGSYKLFQLSPPAHMERMTWHYCPMLAIVDGPDLLGCIDLFLDADMAIHHQRELTQYVDNIQGGCKRMVLVVGDNDAWLGAVRGYSMATAQGKGWT